MDPDSESVADNSKGSADEFLAKPSGACCLKGSIHRGQPQGTFVSIAGVDTYVSKPTTEYNGRMILYFPDVWGMFPNGLLVMDGFAKAGYLVMGLDYFRGVCCKTGILPESL